MVPRIFDAQDYRQFLEAALSFDAYGKRGGKSDLAKYLKCESSFISQVLKNRIHFSLEHGIKVARFLRLSAKERQYLLLLIQRDRAGSAELRDFFAEQAQAMQDDMTSIKAQIRVKGKVGKESQTEYYSMWWYSAIHMLCAFDHTRTPEAIATKLNLEINVVKDVLNFLESVNLVRKSAAETYEIATERVHVPSDSPLVTRHHLNWREKLIEHLQRPQPKDLHYSSIIGISQQDGETIRRMILDFIAAKEKVLEASPSEKPYVLLLDFFELPLRSADGHF